MESTSLDDLRSRLAEVRAAPRARGTVELIARRPAEEEREILEEAQLDRGEGLVGDRWSAGQRHPDTQLTMMSSRAAALVAGPRARWSLAGDQLYVDLDISYDNLPPGTKLQVGGAVIEITARPHTGCGKFLRRFGIGAQKLVNSPTGRALNLRGINARVLTAGTVRRGDAITKLVDETRS